MDFTQCVHYRAAVNVAETGATCHFCGNPITAGELIVDINSEEMAHEVCADAYLEDQREQAA